MTLRIASRIATATLKELKFVSGDYKRERLQAIADKYLEIQQRMDETICIVADNVVEFYADNPKSEYRMSDFPNCVPIGERVLIEWISPTLFRDANGQLQPVPKAHAATLFETCQLTEEQVESIGEPNARWSVTAFYFAFNNGFLHIANLCSSFLLDKSGSLLTQPKVLFDPAYMEDETFRITRRAAARGLEIQIPLLTLSFANCKNVEKRDETETHGPRAKWIRKFKAPEIKYHVLQINPMRNVLRTEGDLEANGIQKAMHICRGHFARYSEDKPLFGKYAGSFWVPAHVKGNAKNGIVVKDYSVKVPTTMPAVTVQAEG